MTDLTHQTQCANCGTEIEIDLTNDPGADAWSVQDRDDYCSWTCEEAAYQ